MPDLATIKAFLEPRHHRLAEEVRAFADAEIAPLEPRHDDEGARAQALEILRLLGQGRWPGHAIPEAFGGHEGAPDLRACCLIRETLASASPLADSVFALQCLGSMPITLAGSEEQKRRYLPGVAAGERMAAFAMTEMEAGSDPSGMETRARRDGEGYRLDGGKAFITNAGIADYYVVFASTDPESGTCGLTCFLVEATAPGFRFTGPQVLSEPHPLGEIAFEGCRLLASSRLGAEGEGFKIGMRTLDRLRPTVAAAACGMAERALAEALAHVRRRRQFGKPLAEFQLTQQKLARMATDLAAARLLTYRAAWEADSGAERITLEAAMAKSFATEAAQRVVDDAVQLWGGRGALRDSPVDRLYRAVRALRIYEGTTEIQHLVIARQVLSRAE
ncbi:MAG: acyl-CoA dehydrogenase [bacterium]|nr:acyl-CoA dehydrogenase [bacterium]